MSTDALAHVPMNDATVSDVTTSDVTTETSVACIIRSFLLRLALATAIVFLFALLSRAGGPKDVAGSAYFNSTAMGQPLTWPQGSITYYTDQGALSPILSNAPANSLVANAFSQWTSIPTAAVSAASGGQLAEDVNGTNVYANADGSITMPADIQSTATGTPVGVVYDYDGTVTDALLGSGAGDSTQCFSNAVFGGDDNFSTLAAYQHALIVINGQCALQSPQLTDVEYRLVRVIGTVLGLGWSQLNLNVITGSPPPTSDDFAGFPVMHYLDPAVCVPITRCYANPYQIATDDAAALSRLYPVTAQNQTSFPGKQVFAATTARIHGSVWFTNAGSPTQAMQGVNVVARWVNPQTSTASGQYAVSSVSGFLFTGNAGNPITGFDDNFGNPLAEWGSNQTVVEGFFDLSGLPLPTGGTAQYRLSIEALDSGWSRGVEPYGPNQVAPSGSFTPIVVTVSAGQDFEQDIWMSGSAQPIPFFATSATWTEPAAVPLAGDWTGSLSGYADEPYFLLSAQANRTLSVAVTALDESGSPTNSKARPVVGMWNAVDPPGTTPSALTTSPFNSTVFGVTRLDAQVNSSGRFLIGIADDRGDGRPDYHYHASVLYADSVSPPRVGVNGGPVTVYGTGFTSGLTAAIGNVATTVLSISAGQMILATPPTPDGLASITITNPANGASTTMTNVLTYGAAATDKLLLLNKTNPPTPVGVQAMNPVSVEVVEADGATPVPGATIAWSTTNGVQLSACGGATACSVVTDGSGEAATWLTPAAVGNATITATLAPGAYGQTQSVNATLVATESSSDIGVLTPYLWIAQGASLSTPLTARVMSNGVPQTNAQVNFTLLQGSGTLSAGTAQTNGSGYASVTFSVTQFSTQTHLTACVAPGNAPCQSIYVVPVPASQWQLSIVSGAGQVSTVQAFQPIVVRVTDSSSPPNAVFGAPIAFLTTVLRPGGMSSGGGGGDVSTGNPAMPVILNVSQSSATSDGNGLASIVPSSAGFSSPLEVDVGVTAGNASLNFPLKLLPAIVSTSHPVGPQPVLPEPWLHTGRGLLGNAAERKRTGEEPLTSSGNSQKDAFPP